MSPTRAQIHVTRAVVRWYIETHWRREGDTGVPAMFMDRTLVGRFAINPTEFAQGTPRALFRLLVACAMFQRRQDQQILRILRAMPAREADEITSPHRLLALSDESPCEHVKSTTVLRERCDLSKDEHGQGCCSAGTHVSCHLKRHTVVMKRYGHFGKVPTSIALAVREQRARSLSDLYRALLRTPMSFAERARSLEMALCRAWRVHQKIACMFLSIVTNPDLGEFAPPWSAGVDWARYVVVDSNVDLFLSSIGYRGLKTYDARREFVRELARSVPLRSYDECLHDYNPRIVQQALYLFMSAANRRSARSDCMYGDACHECPSLLAVRCPVRA